MKNEGYLCVFLISRRMKIFRTAEKPQNLTLILYAHVIIPPNDIEPVKDRLGMFNHEVWPITSEKEILEAVSELMAQDKETRLRIRQEKEEL